MGHYIKAQSIKCHCHFDPNCPTCHGDENYRNEFGLPCICGVKGMTFDEPADVLIAVEAEPLPDGGMRIHMEEAKQGKN